MKKRITSCLLVLCMVLAMFPATAFAAGETHAHAVSVGCETDTGEQVAFTEWGTTDALPSNAGHYVLTTNVTIEETWKAPESGETTLCLNGHTITISCKTNDTCGIKVENSAKLSICDCSAGKTGAIDVNSAQTGPGSTVQSAIYNGSFGTLNLYGGNISINAEQGCYGLELHGTSNICGGTVTATLTNISTSENNCVVYGIRTSSSDNRNISISGGVFEAKCTVENADDNTSLRRYGLLVYEYNNPNLSVTGGVFIGKAGVSADSGITINATGGIFSTDPTGVIDASIGTARVIQDTDPGYKAEYAGYYIVEPAPAQPKHSHSVSVDCSTTEGTQVEFTEWKPGDFNGAFPSDAGNYVLTDNVTINSSETWVISSGINLCLNGHTLTLNGSGDILLDSEGSTLNICDCSEGGKGSIKNVSPYKFLEGIKITHSKAKFNLYGGNIYIESTYSGSDGYAYGVTGDSAYINIYGGTITAKASNNKAVALNISSNTPRFKIYGGVLTAEAPEGKDAYGVYLPSLYTGWNSYDQYSIEGGVFIGKNSIGIGSGADRIKVTGGIFSTNPTAAIDPSYTARVITADDDGYQAEYAGYYIVEPTPAQPAHSHDDITYTPWGGIDAITYTDKTASVYLTQSVTRNSNDQLIVSDGYTLNLCLNGFTINGNVGGLIAVREGGTLNLCDCSQNCTGKIHSKGGMGCIGVYNQGTFTLNSGTVEGSTCGVYNAGKYTCTIDGGTVTGGYGIFNSSDNNAKTYINGGTVTGSDYGVYNSGSSTELYLSGSPSISGVDADIYTEGPSCIFADDGIEDDAAPYSGETISLGYPVTLMTAGTEVVHRVAENAKDKFKLADNNYTLEYDAGKQCLKIKANATTPTTYTVTFNMNGHGTAIAPVTVSSGEKVTKPADPAVTGYTFGGWFKEPACTNEWDFDNDTVTGNTTLYAKWTTETYSVTLNTNGATINSNDVTSYTYGVGATLPTQADMTKTGYRFDGWYENAGFSGSPVTAIPATATGDKVYYAKWVEQHTVSGTITGKDSIQYSNVSAKLVALGGQSVAISSITKTSGENITPEVYSFSGVTVDAGQYNLVVTAKDTTNGSKEVTVTALVDLTEQDARVTLTLPDSIKSSTVKTSADGTPSVIAGGVDQIAEGTDIPDSASSITIELTVDEKQSNDIADDAEKIESVAGGQTIGLYLDIQLQLFKNDETTGTDLGSTNTQILELLVPADTSKTGLTVYRVHDGMAEALKKDSADANGEYFKIGNGFVTIYAKKFSVYALGYTPEDTYTITLDANGGTVNGSSAATLVTGADKKLSSLPTPTRSGSYTFDGWFTAASGGEKVTTETVFASNQTIYAQWTYTGGGGGGYTPTYAITVKKTENGKVEANRSYASSGSTVTLTVTPEDGYVLDRLTVTDSQGNNIEATDKGNGTYTFKMPSRKVTVEAVFVPDGSFSTCTGGSACPIYPYTDADPAAWYHDGVHYCIEKGLMAGYGNNIFKPDAATTRGMLAVMLWRLEGSPVVNYALNFEDVAEGQWYTEAIRWAVSEGIAVGYGNGYFGTNDAITREQLAAMLWRYAGSPESSRSLDHFGDAMEVSSYAAEALAWANEQGIVVGVGNNTLSPQSHATRAQVATMMMRMVQATTK